jgi:hypothetical protein
MTTGNVLSYDEIVDINKPFDETNQEDGKIYFADIPIPYKHFFYMNRLFDKKYKDCIFVIDGTAGHSSVVATIENNDYTTDAYKTIKILENGKKVDITDMIMQKWNERFKVGYNKPFLTKDDTIEKLKINFPNKTEEEYRRNGTTGGRKASVKKEICGKLRCIYKIQGSRKEHIKYKGRLITVADYKKLMKKA